MRTTVDIVDPVLVEVRREQERQGKTLGEVVSELLAEGLAARSQRSQAAPPQTLQWVAKDLRCRIDLRDKEALWTLLDHEALHEP